MAHGPTTILRMILSVLGLGRCTTSDLGRNDWIKISWDFIVGKINFPFCWSFRTDFFKYFWFIDVQFKNQKDNMKIPKNDDLQK